MQGIVYGKPVHQGIKKLKPTKNLRSLAEERVGRACGGLRVLNSYWINQDSTYKYYEVVLVDPAHNAVRNVRFCFCLHASWHLQRRCVQHQSSHLQSHAQNMLHSGSTLACLSLCSEMKSSHHAKVVHAGPAHQLDLQPCTQAPRDAGGDECGAQIPWPARQGPLAHQVPPKPARRVAQEQREEPPALSVRALLCLCVTWLNVCSCLHHTEQFR
jgi:hypothetical protein